jgi:hypothetical protein
MDQVVRDLRLAGNPPHFVAEILILVSCRLPKRRGKPPNLHTDCSDSLKRSPVRLGGRVTKQDSDFTYL